jgi:preprotein translocase subunit SecD
MQHVATKITDRFMKAGWSGLFLVLALFVSALSVSAQPIQLEVAGASLAFDPRTNEPVVTFRMTPASAKVFADLTKKNVGRAVAFIVDGRVIMKPVIREPIIGGSGQLSANLTIAEAKALAERLASGKGRLEVEVQD